MLKMKFLILTVLLSASGALADVGVKQYENFYISGPVNKKILEDFKKKDGAVVIDVRDFDEKGDCGEAIVATKLGMKFYAAPMPKTKPVTKETIALVEKYVAEANGKPVLIFCSTGNRAGAFLAAHLAQKENIPVEEAIAKAKTVGLKSEVVEDEVREFVANPTNKL